MHDLAVRRSLCAEASPLRYKAQREHVPPAADHPGWHEYLKTEIKIPPCLVISGH
jgi:hypothetical protein